MRSSLISLLSSCLGLSLLRIALRIDIVIEVWREDWGLVNVMWAHFVNHPLLVAGVAHPHFLVTISRDVPLIRAARMADNPIFVSKRESYSPHFLQWCFLLIILNLPLQILQESPISLGSHVLLGSILCSLEPDLAPVLVNFFTLETLLLGHSLPALITGSKTFPALLKLLVR